LQNRREWLHLSCQARPQSAAEGPRALEARNRIKKIRLENFIWDNE
jgi:hypothetical protein